MFKVGNNLPDAIRVANSHVAKYFHLMPSRRISIADIARETEMSTGAVSMILRQGGRFSKETRERVMAAAERLGYRPNPVAASYRTGHYKRTSAMQAVPLALVHHGQRPQFEPAQQRADALGYRLDAFDLTTEESPHRLGDVLYARGYRGILLGVLYGVSEFPDLGWERFSCIGVGRPFFHVPFDVVRNTIFELFRHCWRQCVAAGYERIGIDVQIHRSWGELHPDDHARQAAARYLLESVPRRNRVPMHTARLSERASFVRWVEKHRPDAIIGASGGRYAILKEMGCSHLGFASVNVDPEEPWQITGFLEDNRRIVRTAVELMDRQIRHNLLGPQELPLEHLVAKRWNPGETLG